MSSPPKMPCCPAKWRAFPIIPAVAVVPTSFDSSAPVSSFTGSFMCQTLRYPFDSLNTAAPLDSLAASALPQCSLSLLA